MFVGTTLCPTRGLCSTLVTLIRVVRVADGILVMRNHDEMKWICDSVVERVLVRLARNVPIIVRFTIREVHKENIFSILSKNLAGFIRLSHQHAPIT